MKAMITLDSVSKLYPMSREASDGLSSQAMNATQVFEALSDVSLAIPQKSFAAVIGPSGSGKSTLLNIASGLDRPTYGRVLIGETDLGRLSISEMSLFRQNNIGFIFQAYNLFQTLTVLENVEYTMILRGDDSKVARERALKAIEQVGLKDKVRSMPNQLSGGQQQRVAVARAIASHPQVIFADEPTANLDSKTAVQLIELFEKMNQETGVTFLFSTHDSRIVERVTHKIYIEDGKVRS